MHRETAPVETNAQVVTISSVEYAALVEDKRILDLLETPGLMPFDDGFPHTLRQRGRMMLYSRKTVQEWIAHRDGPARKAPPRPTRRRAARAS